MTALAGAPVTPVTDSAAAVLAIDGGNSKTDVAVLGYDGSVLATSRGQGSCHQSIGLDATRALLTSLVTEAFEAAGVTEAAHVTACLAGADLQSEVDDLTALLSDAGWAPSVQLENDTFALLRAGTDAADAVAVVCGAGINCVGVAADGRTARFLALGRISGDWGGGAGLGASVMWFATRAEDGRGEPTALCGAVAGHFGLSSALAVAEAVHLGQISQEELMQLTPVLMEIARASDPVAVALVDRLAEEVCLFATVALRRLDLLAAPADVVLGGGVLTGSGPIVLDRIAARLALQAPHAVIKLVSDPPVVGAALLGFDALGLARAVEAPVRATLPAAVRAR